MPIIDIRAHGGTYAAGKYRKGGEYTDEQVKVVTSKGNGKPYWDTTQYTPNRVIATPSSVFASSGGTVYKYNQSGAFVATAYVVAESRNYINDMDANGNYFAFCDGTSIYGGLRFYSETGGLLWSRQSDASPYFYTNATSVDINDYGEVVYGVGWQGVTKNVHKFAANGSSIWSGAVSFGGVANKSMTHLPNGGAAVVNTNNQIDIFNSSGLVVRTISAGVGTIQCLAADSDGYIYAVVVDSNKKAYVRKIKPTNYTVVNETLISVTATQIYKVMIKGSYVYTSASNIVVKLNKADLGIAATYAQPDSGVYSSDIFVDNNGDLYYANGVRLRKLDAKQYYTLT